ncbi:hypothetical protein AC249_AIPGENE23054 [Exaiptasia diaphana]|nr:hypothetical protein AC249_AIPGENE23054 [Exaiptasia diaphana]
MLLSSADAFLYQSPPNLENKESHKRHRFVVRVIGKIISSLPEAHYGKLHYRNLEREKINALASHNGDFDAFMHISPLAKEELNWWVENSMQFTIDLFAFTLNNQLSRYASWRPDPNASFIEAFTHSWENEYFYTFPPLSLIPKCLEKIIVEQAKGVLVIPMWPTQTLVHESFAIADSPTKNDILDIKKRAFDPSIRPSAQHERQVEVDGMSLVRGQIIAYFIG